MKKGTHRYTTNDVTLDAIDVLVNLMTNRKLQSISSGDKIRVTDSVWIYHINRTSSNRAEVSIFPEELDLTHITSFVVQRFGSMQTALWIQSIGDKSKLLLVLKDTIEWIHKYTDWKIEIRVCMIYPLNNAFRANHCNVCSLLKSYGKEIGPAITHLPLEVCRSFLV